MQTAPVRFGYDRLGRRNMIKTYLPGTLATSIVGSAPPAPVSTLSQIDNDLGEPETEPWSGGPLAGHSVTTSRDSFGRRQGVTTSVADFQAQNVTAYDPAGRPAIITAGSHTATYRYVANSRLRAGVTYRANGTQRLDMQYDFDQLNRLRQVLNQPSAAGQPAERHAYTYNAAQQRIRDELANGSSWNWEYDPLGRRIGRIVSTEASGSWVVTSTTRWLYEGWNPVAELNGAGTLVREHVWGTDLSGNWQGAGGVGGLLWVLEAPTGPNITAHYAAYDGNGNVMALVNAADGTWSARYEYGPFGEVIWATGTMAAVNPFRWSTKIQDEDTGLNYYGYRYYSAGVGRWLGRDPIGNAGGLHLYCAVANDCIQKVDYVGLVDLQLRDGGGEFTLKEMRERADGGFEVDYEPGKKCGCKPGNIRFVQAVESNVGLHSHDWRLDIIRTFSPRPGTYLHTRINTKGGLPWLGHAIETDGIVRGAYGYYDGPSYPSGGTWEFEVCAVCSLGFGLESKIMGCFKFTYKKDGNDKPIWPITYSSGARNSNTVKIAAGPPSKDWETATKEWISLVQAK